MILYANFAQRFTIRVCMKTATVCSLNYEWLIVYDIDTRFFSLKMYK